MRQGFLLSLTNDAARLARKRGFFFRDSAGPRRWIERLDKVVQSPHTRKRITDADKVFHSFRHLFKDALRAADVPLDLNDALLGQATRGSVGRR
jgi:hypothetical protein